MVFVLRLCKRMLVAFGFSPSLHGFPMQPNCLLELTLLCNDAQLKGACLPITNTASNNNNSNIQFSA
jgi:hypothetical protein